MKNKNQQRKIHYNKIIKFKYGIDIPWSFPESRYINAGVMIVNKDSRDFLEIPEIIENDDNLWEQTYLNCRTCDFDFQPLNRYWNAGHIHREENFEYAKNEAGFVHFNLPPHKSGLKDQYLRSFI